MSPAAVLAGNPGQPGAFGPAGMGAGTRRRERNNDGVSAGEALPHEPIADLADDRGDGIFGADRPIGVYWLAVY